MTKPSAVPTRQVDQYHDYNLHQLETALQTLERDPPTPASKQTARVLRQALRLRLRLIKSRVIAFEATNHSHLLVSDSTDHFAKIAGHSVLFYAFTLASRLHRRFSIKPDTDAYYRSDDGIISLRSLEQLTLQLAEIQIFPDPQLSTPELHFFALPQTYDSEAIAKFRDRSRQDIARINAIIVPKSPAPDLYALILELNRLLYQNCRHISDRLARETIVRQLILDANEMIVSYLNFANAKTHSGIARPLPSSVSPLAFVSTSNKPLSAQAHNLLNLMIYVRSVRNNLANLENLRLLHHRELCLILEKIVDIERLAAHQYAKQLRHDRTSPNS